MMAETAVAWLLLEGAVIAEQKRAGATEAETAFYQGKLAAARFYARNVLPGVEHKAQLLLQEDLSPLEISDAGFASV
jgi:hypothetical protein